MKVDKKRDREIIDDCYAQIFNTDEGKIVLTDLKNQCYFTLSTFTGNPSPEEIFRREGMRTVVLRIEGTLQRAKERNRNK